MAGKRSIDVSHTWPVYQTLFSDHLEAVNAAPMTIRTYGIAVRQLGEFLEAQGAPANPETVTRELLVDWMRFLQRPKSEGGQGLAAQTALQRFRSASRFFAFLAETGDITESPMARMKPPRVPEKLVPVIADEDLKKLFHTCAGRDFESRRDRAIISVFLDTGIRVSEMAGLAVTDVDLEERDLIVLGKGRRPRRLRFVKETRTDILRYFLAREKHPHSDAAGLWIGKRGVMQPNGIYQMLKRRCEEAGIPPSHPHKFRHTFAHLYLKGGGSEGDLMRVTGWRSRQMLDRYGASVAADRTAEAHDQFSPRARI